MREPVSPRSQRGAPPAGVPLLAGVPAPVAEDDVALERLANAAQARFKTAEEVAVTVMRDAILGGILRPGDRLNQERIATALGMSRIPVRAGLRQLEAERLVTIHPFRGATVMQLTEDDIDELYELRETIECLALRHAAEHLTPELTEVLSGHARYLDEAASVDEEWIAARERFYETLFSLSGRRRTADLVAALRIEIGGYIAAYQVHRVHTGHLRFLGLLSSGDIDGAVVWHREHLLAVRDLLKQQLRDDRRRDGTIGDDRNPLHVLRNGADG